MNPQTHFAVALAILAIILGGCASNNEAAAPVDGAVDSNGETIERLGPTESEPWNNKLLADKRATGMMLAGLDNQLDTWCKIVLQGRETQDLRRVDLIEDSIKNEVRGNLQTIIDQLETGPEINRTIAAAALGFSDVPKTLGPLLAALEDPSDRVVANALLGISALNSPNTPVVPLADKLRDADSSVSVRNNAGRAIRGSDLEGLTEEERESVIEAARVALGDEERAVRVHGALILAAVADANSINRLAICLDDEEEIVAQAASRSLARIGDVDHHAKGSAARALVNGLDRVDHRTVRAAILRDLQLLGGRNYGDDEEQWTRWARDLP